MGTEDKNREYFLKFVNGSQITVIPSDGFEVKRIELNAQDVPKKDGWYTLCDEIWNEFRKKYCDSIIAIKEIVPNKVYEYTFGGGDVQKTVCSDCDQFSMEGSITIAYAKHFMGGSGKYNRAVDKAMKMFENQKNAEEKAKKEKEDAEARRVKKAKKRAERLARKREAELEEKIAIQAEAYRRAMESMKKDGKNA